MSISSRAQRPFHVICKPVGPRCNLACEYCFYLEKDKLFPDVHGEGFLMGDETLERFIAQYIMGQSEGTRELDFSWQGGEPTLAGIEFFRKVRILQKRYEREEMVITNSLQTNATLLDDEWASFLKEEGFLVGVSLDGPEVQHNRYRRTKDGRGSFQQVMRGLEHLHRRAVPFNILCAVQSENADHPEELYRFFRSIEADHLQFIPIVEPLHGGGVSTRTVSAEQWGAFLNTLFLHWITEDIGSVFIQHFEMLLGVYLGLPATLCAHAPSCGRALALEHDGSLYSCDHAVLPSHRLGSIHTQQLSQMADSAFQNRFGEDKHALLPPECASCSFLALCYGGCPLQRTRTSRCGEGMLNHLCEGYRSFYSFSAPYYRQLVNQIRRSQGYL